MFDAYCPQHEARVLLGPRSVDAIVRTPDGVVVHWHCHCGATGTLAPTSRPAEPKAAAT